MLKLLIRSIHFFIVLYFILTPLFVTNKELLRNYIILSIFLMFHWVTNNDTCALTMIEGYLTDQKEDETFLGQIIKPVYRISSREIYIALIVLTIIATYKYFY